MCLKACLNVSNWSKVSKYAFKLKKKSKKKCVEDLFHTAYLLCFIYVFQFHDIKECKPRPCVLADNMRRTRSQLKYAIRFFKWNTESIVSDKIANGWLKRNTQEFWSEIKKLISHKPLQVDNIDGVQGEKNIAKHWKESLS